MSETDLSRSIRQALAAMGVWVIRIQAGQHRVKGGVLQCAEPGTPDLFCPALNLWLEVKTPKGALEASQVAWHQRAIREGLQVAVVRAVSDAVQAVQGSRRSEAARSNTRGEFRCQESMIRARAIVVMGGEPLHNTPSRARTGNDGIGGPLTTLRRILLVAAGRKLRPEEFAEGQRATAEAERATAVAVDEARALVRVEVAEAQQQAANAIREVGELKDELHRVKDAVLAALDHECEY